MVFKNSCAESHAQGAFPLPRKQQTNYNTHKHTFQRVPNPKHLHMQIQDASTKLFKKNLLAGVNI